MNKQHCLDPCTQSCIDGGYIDDGCSDDFYIGDDSYDGSRECRGSGGNGPGRSTSGSLSRFGGFLLATACVAFACGLAMPRQVAAQEGATLYETCVACHGAQGEGNAALGAPALAAQLPAYIDRQLLHFQQGVRGSADGDSYGAQMRPFAAMLADAEARKSLADYIGAMAPVTDVPVGDGDPNRGANLYNGNCGACHGGRAEGNEALGAPRLAGLDRAYVTRQLRHYREGLRGADPADRLGRQMAMMSRTITAEAAISDVLSYIDSLVAKP